jgi:S1-C subfamily serine protease
VEQGSPAKEAGLCRGDIILSLGGEEAQTVEELRSIMTTLPIDAQALVSVLREGALTTCLITPSKRPQLAI